MKDRVKSVMNYKKPGLWVVILAVVICILVGVCFVTNPAGQPVYTRSDHDTDFVQSIAIRNGDDSYEITGAASIDYVLDWLSRVKVSRSTLSPNRSEDRDKTNAITIRHTNLLRTDYYFSADYSSVWVNDSVKPSLSRSVHNTEFVKQFFESRITATAKQRLSINDCIILSGKGYDLTWADFEQFRYTETGSGLYIRVYEINDMYELRVGGADPDSQPMYVYLMLTEDPDTRIDIRDGSVTEFISQNRRPKFYLTIGAEGVKRIELSLPYTSGGCENADGSLFRKGDRVWLELLDGCSDLRGLTITAKDANGYDIFSVRVSDYYDSENPDDPIVCGEWVITSEK